jgi:hypothetical protein
MHEFVCPYLEGNVELTDERKLHIAERHPELLPEHLEWIVETLANPDQVRKSVRFGNENYSLVGLMICITVNTS